ALEGERADVEEGRRADDRRDLPALQILDLREPGVLARDDGPEHGGGHAGDLERHAVLERLGGEREAHVDGVDVLGGELVQERAGRTGDDRVLGGPAVLAEQFLLVNDLGYRPPELQIRDPYLPLALSGSDGRRTGPRGGSGGQPEKPTSSDHALAFHRRHAAERLRDLLGRILVILQPPTQVRLVGGEIEVSVAGEIEE